MHASECVNDFPYIGMEALAVTQSTASHKCDLWSFCAIAVQSPHPPSDGGAPRDQAEGPHQLHVSPAAAPRWRLTYSAPCWLSCCDRQPLITRSNTEHSHLGLRVKPRLFHLELYLYSRAVTILHLWSSKLLYREPWGRSRWWNRQACQGSRWHQL